MPLFTEPIPADDVVTSDRKITNAWFDWLLNLINLIGVAATRAATIALAGQSASIAATPIVAGKPGGRFRVTVYARIDQAASVSSSLTVTIGFTDGGNLCAFATAPLVNGGPTSAVSQSWMFDNDPAVAMTYATTYASAGATPMKYRLRIVLESMS